LISTTTFCTGYWRVDNNQKKTTAQYLRHFAGLCHHLRNGRLVVFHEDDDILAHFREVGRSCGVRIVGRRIAFTELPTFHLSERLLAGCRAMAAAQSVRPTAFRNEKGTLHFWRDYVDGGEDVYRRLVTIWTSKIPLVLHAGMGGDAESAPRYAWVDASIARFDRRRSGWRFAERPHPPQAVAHYRSVMRFRGERLPINASLLSAPSARWPELDALFRRTLEGVLADAYAHDEETVLGLCHRRHPGLFVSIGGPVGRLRRRWMALGAGRGRGPGES
jgi:hypothetical protein